MFHIKDNSGYKTTVNGIGSLLGFPCLNFCLLDGKIGFEQGRMLDCKVKEAPWSLLRGTMSPQYSWHMLHVLAKGSDIWQFPDF